MKKQQSRILMLLAGLLLLLLFTLPLWRITLLAPQYPDGVHMFIYIDKIGGSTPGTLQNVNILNHYIGMKPIVPESIPELQYFPYVIIAFVITALLFAVLDRGPLYLLWVSLLSIGFVLALYDFYLWEYDYGHNLDPSAPMKFEGESFQPPLFGSKNLLNFVAKSYPHAGGFVLMISWALAAIASYLKLKKS